ncbi:LAQU0S03e03400g1_1 [Lachancea quebecensis]|uniref:LAQU0S03e03400g1_1 n=1 Tax=Lachancea quebecensis TaxID=1654605 RepID=A0A0P1KRG1_9SACH|nr:LAQU0S03e03400g1_1 [Lachancea quebecensis]
MEGSSKTIKKHDLYAFELPKEILGSLELMVFDASVAEVPAEAETRTTEPEVKKPVEAESSYTRACRTCGEEFSSEDLQKSHYKSDYHRFNIKRKLNDMPALSLDEFEVMTENDDVESISGSDTEPESEEEEDIYREDKDKLSAILENQVAKLDIQDSISGSKSHLNTRSPHIYFKSPMLPEDEVFSAFKALFSKTTISRPLETIFSWNDKSESNNAAEAPFSALFMVGGGHFAGAIVSHKRLNIRGHMTKGNETLQERAVQFLEHKTFHRYTTRRKQGGAQSAMDNSKGKANSAGSSLRRYNETALRVDIQQLLRQWEPYLKNCENIFIRAKSTSDQKMFIDSNTCINKDDPRLRSFPFTTKRPTGHELKRAWCELSYLHIDSKPKAVITKESTPEVTVRKEQKTLDVNTQKQDPEVTHTKEIVALLKKSRAPMLISYIKKNDLDVNFILQPTLEYAQTPTMLHYASQQGLKNMVSILLNNLKCDPTLRNINGRTPWDLTKKKEVHQAFQIARYNLGESFTNWEASNIGEALSKEQVETLNEEESKQKEAERAEAIKKELAAAKAKQELEKEAKRGPGRTLLPQVSATQQTMNSLSENQRMRLMREQRARAAEARMRQNMS